MFKVVLKLPNPNVTLFGSNFVKEDFGKKQTWSSCYSYNDKHERRENRFYGKGVKKNLFHQYNVAKEDTSLILFFG